MPTSPYRGPIGACVRSIVINSGLGRSEQIRGKGKGKTGQASKATGYGVWSSLRQKRRGPLWTYRQQWEHVEAVSEHAAEEGALHELLPYGWRRRRTARGLAAARPTCGQAAGAGNCYRACTVLLKCCLKPVLNWANFSSRT